MTKKEYDAEYYQKHKEKYSCYRKWFFKNNPWLSHLYDARKRCNNIKNLYYNRYGGRGIKCILTPIEIKYLWSRDNAKYMKQPSIDRIDNDKNYEINNCRFIEMVENSAKDKRKIILQFTKSGDFIAEWRSLMDVERTTGIHHSGISMVLNLKRKYAGGFSWKYSTLVRMRTDKD